MRLTLTGRHVDISAGLRRLVERKMARLERLLNTRAVSGQVELYLEKFRHVAEIHVHARGGHMLQGRAVATSWGEAMAEAVDRTAQQAQTLKGKWETRKRAARPARRPSAAPGAAPVTAETARRIVRAKRYAVRLMSITEAAGSVAERADAFVVFRNDETNQVNVLFRRPDGDLGLIEPRS
jgi:putative sigma-54 modulation protein